MRDAALVARLARVHDILAPSFVRYLVEAAGPRVEGEWDLKAFQAISAWAAAEGRSLERIRAALAAERHHPGPPAWPLEFSQYHFVGAAYLLAPVMRRMEPLMERAAAESAGFEGWPEAQKLVGEALAGSRSHLATVRALEAARPKEPPKPGVKKGVSASRW